MSSNQHKVLAILLAVAVLELGLTTRLTKLWHLAFRATSSVQKPTA